MKQHSNNPQYLRNGFKCLDFYLLQELDGDRIDKSSAYILFFEREGLNAEEYLPKVDTTAAKPELGDLDDELEMDFKKQCAVMQTTYQFKSIFKFSQILLLFTVLKLNSTFSSNNLALKFINIP